MPHPIKVVYVFPSFQRTTQNLLHYKPVFLFLLLYGTTVFLYGSTQDYVSVRS